MIYKTQLGNIEITQTNDIITELHFTDKEETINNPSSILMSQINEYFKGARRKFDVSHKLTGTEFQKKVYAAINDIPYGSTSTYKKIAEMIGRPKAARAVGMACNKNPLLLLIPCHRVVSSTGSLTGYQGGLEIKRKLLKLEKENG